MFQKSVAGQGRSSAEPADETIHIIGPGILFARCVQGVCGIPSGQILPSFRVGLAANSLATSTCAALSIEVLLLDVIVCGAADL